MSVGDWFFGKAGGETLFQKFRQKWQARRIVEKQREIMKGFVNPFNCQLGDVVEVRGESYELEAIFCYGHGVRHNFMRYGLRHLVDGSQRFLEVVPGHYTLWTLEDEFARDDGLLGVIRDEEYLEHSFGEAELLVYRKDFVALYEVNFLLADETLTRSVQVANYVRFTVAGEEEVLAVEHDLGSEWMSIYVGRQVLGVEINALGTL